MVKTSDFKSRETGLFCCPFEALAMSFIYLYFIYIYIYIYIFIYIYIYIFIYIYIYIYCWGWPFKRGRNILKTSGVEVILIVVT